MKLLITGGAGFMGSNFIRYILKKYPDYKIINLDKLTYAGNLENLRDVERKPNYKFVKGDICDQKVVDSLAKDSDIIINYAAESVSKNTFLPIWCAGKIKIMTMDELFNNLSKKRKNKVVRRGEVEVINLKHTNYKALSYKGGIGYWMPIKQISRHRYKGKLIKLSQKWGEIEVTPNHSIYDSNFNLTTPLKNPELLGLRNINHISKKDEYLGFRKERLFSLVRILSAYITEGWTSYNKKNGSFHFGVTNGNKKWVFRLKQDLKLLGFNPNITFTKDKLFQLIISNKSFFNFVRKEAGFGSHNKFIPPFIFQLKRIFQEEFFKTMIFGDGETIKNKNYDTLRYTTVSQKNATGFSLLLSLLRYNYSVSIDERFNAYTFRIGGNFNFSLLTKRSKKVSYNDYVYDISVNKLKNFTCGVGNIVVHNTHVDRSIMSPREFAMTDIIGTQTLLEAAKKYKHRLYVQISTDEVFGSTESGKFTENSPFLPNSPYAASKAGGDLLCRAYAITYKMPIIVTHSCNFFGPYQYPEKFIPLFITNLLEGKKVPLYGKGGNIREWIYAEDHCSAIDFILHHGKAGEVYNIGTGWEKSNLEITKLILGGLGKDEKQIEFVKDRPAHDWRYSLDSSKLRSLGWQPKYEFKDALLETIEWYKNNEKWWKPLKSGEYLKYYEKQYKNT